MARQFLLASDVSVNARMGAAALTLILIIAGPAVANDAKPDTFNRDVRSVLDASCKDCHNDSESRGGISFDSITSADTVMGSYPLWKKVIKQVSRGTMPPKGETALSADEKQRLLGWIQTAFDTRDNPDPGPSLVRQMTREEYSQTMRDLLGFWHDSAGEAGIPHERVVDGFTNQAGGQVLESSLMERYFTAADLSLEKLFTERGADGARRKLGISSDVATLAKAWQTNHKQAPPKDEATGLTLTRNAARQVLQGLMRRAFRRPVRDEEVERYAAIADTALKAGDTFSQALRKAMKPVLVSPHFLLRVEMGSQQLGKVVKVNDHELAVRLSYFLWGTMPDDELFAVADKGTLSQPNVLEQQVRRMLKHRQSEALTRYFLTQWLQLPQLYKALPSQNNFPTYTRSLRDAMERETWLFCDNLRKEDRSVLDLLNADYTFVNAELAKHYKLKEVPSKEFAKVTLRPEDHRGGVLGMGSILTMTSHTDRTKPTARGKWILEVLLGSPPPPPPANAGSFAPRDKNQPEPETFREKLAQHAKDANCVSCHRRIDPLGFALENYDAIGSWRDSVGGSPVDNHGRLRGIGNFQGVDGLRRVLRAEQSQFVRNLTEQTLRYALGRDVSYYDEPSITDIMKSLEQNEYRISTLILEVVKSYPFQHRRSESEQP